MLIDIAFLLVVGGILYLLWKRTRKNDTIQKTNTNAGNPVQNNEGQRWRREQPDEGAQSDSNDSEQDKRPKSGEELKKALKKQQRQQERKQRQEQIENMVRMKNKKYDKKREEEERLEKEQEQKQRKQQEYLQKIAEQDRKKKQEEYKKWKDFFVVESSGNDKKSAEEQEAEKQAFNQSMLSYIQDNKISQLEQMSHHFKLTTKAVVDKIKEFQAEGKINGIFDERGKYIDVLPEEWQKIMEYMRANGRVSKTEMMRECAKIVKVQSNKSKDKELLNLINIQQQEAQA